MIVIIKPTLACNFRCKYCYLSSETKVPTTMDLNFAKQVLLEVKEQNHSDQKLEILWHGGEPLLWGIENYRNIFDFIDKEFYDVRYAISMQTNLSLITNEYIDLFVKHNVSVGISLDGPKSINDSERVFPNGNGTFDSVISKLTLCREKGLNTGCIVVATRNHIGKMRELYDFMCDYKISFKMNPLFISGEAIKNKNELGLSIDEYVAMSTELFDLWFFDDNNKINNSKFIDIASGLMTKKMSLCSFGENCQDHVVCISPTGEVLPCGRFCDSDLIQFSYGNLHTEHYSDILQRIKVSKAYKRAEFIKNSNCSKCKYYEICHGGCLHDGFINSGNFESKTFMCSANKRIFSHIERRLKETGMLEVV